MFRAALIVAQTLLTLTFGADVVFASGVRPRIVLAGTIRPATPGRGTVLARRALRSGGAVVVIGPGRRGRCAVADVVAETLPLVRRRKARGGLACVVLSGGRRARAPRRRLRPARVLRRRNAGVVPARIRRDRHGVACGRSAARPTAR